MTMASISKLITYMKEQDDGNHIIFVGTVTDDDGYNTRGVNDDEVIPPLNVIALSFTKAARARIQNGGGKCVCIHQLPLSFQKKFLFTFPKGTMLIFKPNKNNISTSSITSNQTTMRNVRRKIQEGERDYYCIPTTTTPFMDNLNDDLLCEILIRLPAKTLGGLKVINKRWYSFISDPSFVSKHTTSLLQTAARGGHSTFISRSYQRVTTLLTIDCPAPNLFTETTFTLGLPPPANYRTPTFVPKPSVAATGRGLLIVDTGCNACIYNPLTKKSKSIPSPYKMLSPYYGIIFGGSGGQYDHNHYTLVCLVEAYKAFKFMIFSPEKRRWRNSNKSSRINYGINGLNKYSVCRETLPVCYRGIIHWLTEQGYIVAFNLDKEESRMIEIPKSVMAVQVNTNWWNCTWLGVLEDEVILLVATSKHEIVTWVLHDYENNKWKIKRKDVIQLERIPVVYIRPLFFDGRRFLLTISTNIYNKFRCKVHLRMEHDVSTGISKPLRSEGHSSSAGSLLCVPITSTLTEV